VEITFPISKVDGWFLLNVYTHQIHGTASQMTWVSVEITFPISKVDGWFLLNVYTHPIHGTASQMTVKFRAAIESVS
jgi:hypothetical protein